MTGKFYLFPAIQNADSLSWKMFLCRGRVWNISVFGIFPCLGLQKMEKKGREKPMLFAGVWCSFALFGSVWSGVWGSNVWECSLKCVSEPSAGTLPPSLALSSAPAVYLWHSFGLRVSNKTFFFWDGCGIGFCILKEIPSGVSRKDRLNRHRGAAQEMRRINKE